MLQISPVYRFDISNSSAWVVILIPCPLLQVAVLSHMKGVEHLPSHCWIVDTTITPI